MVIQAYHHSQQSFFRNPFGAVPCGRKVSLKLEIRSAVEIEQEACRLRLWERETEKLINMKLEKADFEAGMWRQVFQADFVVPSEPCLVWYYFMIALPGEMLFYGNNRELLGGMGELSQNEPPSYQLTVFRDDPVPDWFKQGIMYQIFVDRFYNGNKENQVQNAKAKSMIHGDWYDTPCYFKDEAGKVIRWDFFGGNLAGVIAKLPYLKELGISIIYFNPIFEAASNHKYDTGNYRKIDPMFGDEAVFDRLIREASRLGISVILDGVFSHTGSDSIYFNKYGNYPGIGASQSKDSPYYSWYRFRNYPDDYECWWGVEALPNVNEMEPSYREYIISGRDSAVRYWMRKGVKGWRLDVADELPDQFIKELRQAVAEENQQAVLIGEVWEDASHKMSYGEQREYLWGEELHSVTNYPLREILIGYLLGKMDAVTVHRRVMSLYENYPRESFCSLMNLIGSHDRERVLTVLGEAPTGSELTERERESYRLGEEQKKLAGRRLKLLALLQLTFPGVPCIYYGDEAGVEGYADPYNRGTYPWGRENMEILEWYQRLTKIRREYAVLQQGEFHSFPVSPEVYAYSLEKKEEKIIVISNRSVVDNWEVDLSSLGLDCKDKDTITLDLLTGERLAIGKNYTSGINNAEGQEYAAALKIEPLAAKIIFSRQITEGKTIGRQLERGCGVLLHITSLPSVWGTGDLGEGAYQFVDFLAAAGQNVWQVLPLNPPQRGLSPYQARSVFAGNPLLISIEQLMAEGLLEQHDVEKGSRKEQLCRMAFSNFQMFREKGNAHYDAFVADNSFWLDDYCLFAALEESQGDIPWRRWETGVTLREEQVLAKARRELSLESEYHKFLQYTVSRQWQKLKKYANSRGIKIVGDLPLYVAGDSCDTWVNRELFSLNPQGEPELAAGVPPDYFSQEGQLWGNPLYQWESMARDDFSWWRQRIKHSMRAYDFLRLDHFRGLEAYWEVPAGERTALNGRWQKGPGKRFFEVLFRDGGPLPLIAEDLGFLTPEVSNLRNTFLFPGMIVYQFSAEEENGLADLPPNTVYYTGTHDNDTLAGWYAKKTGRDKLDDEESRTITRKIITELYQSQAAWVIIPVQDLLALGSEARMNTPGTVEGNWLWQMKDGALNRELSGWLGELAAKCGRRSHQT